jgi:hypothetical protein
MNEQKAAQKTRSRTELSACNHKALYIASNYTLLPAAVAMP